MDQTESRKGLNMGKLRYQRGRGQYFGGYTVSSPVTNIVVGHVLRRSNNLALWSAFSVCGFLIGTTYTSRESAAQAAWENYVEFAREKVV